MIRSTHTYATLEVSAEAYDEVKRLLEKAEYHHAFHEGLIDMHGIALERGAATASGPPLPELQIRGGGMTDTELLDRWQAIADAKEPGQSTLRQILAEAITAAADPVAEPPAEATDPPAPRPEASGSRRRSS